MDLTRYTHDALPELYSGGVVSEFVVNGVQCEHHQPECDFVFAVYAEKEQIFYWDVWRGALFQIIGKQVVYKLAFQDVLNAVLRSGCVTKRTDTACSALVSASGVPSMIM
jgi:hypothetical protein